jgi:hypothetical protein
MFDRLFGRGASREPSATLPTVRNVTIGRSVVLDPLAWRRFRGETRFTLDRDALTVTAQGLIALDDGAFVHRFYTDDHVMLQAVSDDREGVTANDFTLFTPWSSDYPADGAARRAWADRLRARAFTAEGLPSYDRFWFGLDAAEQAPVTFWEEVFDDRASETPYARLYQTSMLFARDLPQEGRELLLAVTVEPEKGDLTHDIMIGLPLSVGEFKA